jgi:hypothetical protein
VSQTASLLAAKAREQGIDLNYAPDAQKVLVYQLTIKAIEELLDTGDRTQLTIGSLTVLRQDILDIITGLRTISPLRSSIMSVTGVLLNLREARDELDTAAVYLNQKGMNNSFFRRLSKAQSFLDAAHKALYKFSENLFNAVS